MLSGKLLKVLTGKGCEFRSQSVYATIGNTLIRISDHAPKSYNFDEYNEEFKSVILIFLNPKLSEGEIDKITDDLNSEYNYEVDFHSEIFDESCEYLGDVNSLKQRVDKFLS